MINPLVIYTELLTGSFCYIKLFPSTNYHRLIYNFKNFTITQNFAIQSFAIKSIQLSHHFPKLSRY